MTNIEIKSLDYDLRESRCFWDMQDLFPNLISRWTNKTYVNKIVKEFAKKYNVKSKDVKKEVKHLITLQENKLLLVEANND